MALSIETRRAVRTGIQAAVALAVALPGIVAASGVPQDTGVVVGALAVAGGFARVMALPSVQGLLRYVGLNTDES
jgi:hypothetical protein